MTHSPPCHPASNGIVDHFEKVCKFQIVKAIEKFLYNYRNLPRTEDQIIPSHRMFSFKPRTELTRLVAQKKVRFEVDERSKRKDTTKVVMRKVPKIEFKADENVLNLSRHQHYSHWYPAKIISRLSDFVYEIIVSGIVKKVHVNQL